MKNGASGRRKASRLSTGTSKTETSSDLQRERRTTHDRRTDGQPKTKREGQTDGWRADGWRRAVHPLTFLDSIAAHWGEGEVGPEGGERIYKDVKTFPPSEPPTPPPHPPLTSDSSSSSSSSSSSPPLPPSSCILFPSFS